MNIWIIYIGIVARIMSVFIVAFFVIPKQIQEARLRNGLRLYRHGMLLWTSLFLITVITSLTVLFDTLDEVRTIELQNGLSIVNTLNSVLTAFILFSFYNQKEPQTKGGAKK
jgi:hypothetical protein